MRYNFLIVFLFLISCSSNIQDRKLKELPTVKNFSNKGFTLVYSIDLNKKKIISKKLDTRSLIIFQKNIKKKSKVKITNLINNKSIIVEAGGNSKYPLFYNSVITPRIANEIELSYDEPYIEILEIDNNSTFIANKAKTYEEEKEVADKAPVVDITIKSINNETTEAKKEITKKSFKYIIKIADFYYIDTAKTLKTRITEETESEIPKIEKISKTKFRLYLGPFLNITALKSAFNDISNLQFENIEIIKL